MAGRAGRRGIDSVGTVIICQWHEATEIQRLKKMILGKVERLESKFRLTYKMILNLLRVEEFRVEDMIKRSFSESEMQRELPKRRKILQLLEEELKAMPELHCIYGEPDMENYFPASKRIREIDQKLQKQILKASSSKLTTGRVVVVQFDHSEKVTKHLAVILIAAKNNSPIKRFRVFALVLPEPEEGLVTIHSDKPYKICEVDENQIVKISTETVKVEPKKLYAEYADER